MIRLNIFIIVALVLIVSCVSAQEEVWNVTPEKGGTFNGIMAGSGSTSTTGWVGDEKYGWYATRIASTGSVNYNTTSAANGTQSLDVVVTDATGHFTITNTPAVDIALLSKYAIPIKPSTSYNVYGFVKTSNAQGTGAYISTTQYASTAAAGTTSASSKLTGTNGYTKLQYSFISDANAAYVVITLDHAADAASQIANYQVSLSSFKDIETGGNHIMSDPFAYIDFNAATPLIKFHSVGSFPLGCSAVLNIAGSYEVSP